MEDVAVQVHGDRAGDIVDGDWLLRVFSFQMRVNVEKLRLVCFLGYCEDVLSPVLEEASVGRAGRHRLDCIRFIVVDFDGWRLGLVEEDEGGQMRGDIAAAGNLEMKFASDLLGLLPDDKNLNCPLFALDIEVVTIANIF